MFAKSLFPVDIAIVEFVTIKSSVSYIFFKSDAPSFDSVKFSLYRSLKNSMILEQWSPIRSRSLIVSRYLERIFDSSFSTPT